MAWTAPRTYTTGEIVTATILNTDVRDNLVDLDRRTTVTGGLVTAAETTASTSFTDLTTVGPAVTVTIGSTGKALVAVYASIDSNTTSARGYMGFGISGATTLAASLDRAIGYANSAVANRGGRMGSAFLQDGLNAGSTTFTAKYRADDTGTSRFADRRILVTPLGS